MTEQNPFSGVDLFSGQVNFPINLITLTGTNGLTVDVTLFYHSSIQGTVGRPNAIAPTSIVGLGWSLPFEMVATLGNPLEYNNRRYALRSSRGSPLIYTGTDNDAEIYQLKSYQFWDIRYYPANERWVFKHEDGLEYVYGDETSQRNTVQWAVRRGNWLGASSASGQQRYGRYWNLSEVRNVWGDAITFTYTNIDVPVTMGGTNTYTQASYLSRIDSRSGAAIFNYAQKSSQEYAALHGSSAAAFQDRYEQLYLTSIDVLPGGMSATPIRSIFFHYEDGANTAFVGTGATSKRLLMQIENRYPVSSSQDNALPNLTFQYDEDNSHATYGRLVGVTTPKGSTFSYTYAQQTIDLSARQYTTSRPSQIGVNFSKPRVWIAEDYVVITWAGDDNTIRIQAFIWRGRWLASDCGSLTLSDASQYDSLNVIARRSQFVVQAGNQLLPFRLSDVQVDGWNAPAQAFTLTELISGEPVLLAAGDGFAAVLGGQSGKLFLYRWNGQQWQSAATMTRSATPETLRFALTANDDYVMVLDAPRSGSNAVMKFSLLQPATSGGWTQYDYTRICPLSSVSSVSLLPGAGFVGLHLRQDSSVVDTHLYLLYNWTPDHQTFTAQEAGRSNVTHGTAVAAPVVVGSMFAIDQRVYRYDGVQWVYTNLQAALPYNNEGDHIISAYAADQVVRKIPTTVIDQYIFDLAIFDPVSESWRIPSGITPIPQSNASNNVVRAAQFTANEGQYALVGSQLSARQPDNSWAKTNVALPADLTANDGQTVALVDDRYLIYEQAGNTRVYLLHDGSADTTPIPLDNSHMYVDGTPGKTLIGRFAFVTYSDSTFDAATGFTLYYVVSGAIKDTQVVQAIQKLTCNDGYETVQQAYSYTAATATIDETGNQAQFNHAAILPGLSDPAAPAVNGRSDYYFFNGLSQSTALSLAYPTDDNTNASVNTVALSGISYGSQVQNAAGSQVASEVYNWYVYLQALGSVDVGYYVRARQVVTTTDGVPLGLVHIYGSTGLVSQTQMTFVDADGATQSRSEDYLYWSDIPSYRADTSAHLLTPIVQITYKTGNVITGVAAVTWKNTWSGTNNGWGEHKTYVYTGSGTATFNFDAWSGTNEPAGGDAASWLKVSEVLARSGVGAPTVIRDNNGHDNSYLQSTNGLLEVVSAQNADFTADEISYYGCEPYEDPLSWGWVSSDSTILSDHIVTTDWHTGSRCILLAGSTEQRGPYAQFIPQDQARPYLFSCWVKTPTGFGSGEVGKTAQWTITITNETTGATISNGSSLSQPILITDTQNKWTYVERLIDLPAIASQQAGNPQLGIHIFAYNQHSIPCYIDNLCFMPLNTSLTATVYQPDNYAITAILGPNGQTSRLAYDRFNRVIARTDASEQVTQLAAYAYSRSTTGGQFSPDYPNVQVDIQATQSGQMIQFKPGALDLWSFPNNDSAQWTVSNNALSYSGSVPDPASPLQSAVQLKSYTQKNFALRVEITPPTSGRVGVGTGDIFVFWNVSGATWDFVYKKADGTYATQTYNQAPVGFRPDWTLLSIDGLVLLLVDGIQVLSLYNTDYYHQQSATQLYLAASQPVSFRDVIVANDPYTTLTVMNGRAAAIGQFSLEDGNSLVAQSIAYDSLGRLERQYEPSDHPLAIDASRHLITGNPASYLPTAPASQARDAGAAVQPYTSGSYEASPLDRPVAITPNGNLTTHPVRLGYTGTDDAGLGDVSTAGTRYTLRKMTDPNGVDSYREYDQAGQIIARKLTMSTNSGLLSTASYDASGNLLEIRPPNYHNSPKDSNATDWRISYTYDYWGRPGTVSTPSGGQDQAIYNNAGQLRFLMYAVGKNAVVGSPDTFAYYKYDGLGRIIEEGTITLVWNVATLQGYANQPDLPNVATNSPAGATVKRLHTYLYDGDTTPGSHAVGRLWKQQTYADNGSLESEEQFSYDVRGNLIKHVFLVQSQTYTTQYTYNSANQVVQIDYPTAQQAFSVSYTYNRLGQVIGVGQGAAAGAIVDPANPPTALETYYAAYTYTPTGAIAQQTLNNAHTAISRQFTHDPNDWLTSIDDPYFTETLTYTTGGYGGSAYFDGKIASESYAYHQSTRWPQPPANYSVTYQYDNAGQLLTAQNSLDDSLSLGVHQAIIYDGNGNLATASRGATTFTYMYGSSKDRMQPIQAATNVTQGFEGGEARTGWSWGNSANFTSDTGIVSTDAHSGSACLQLAAAILGSSEYARYETYIDPWGVYELSIWVKTQPGFGAYRGSSTLFITVEDHHGVTVRYPLAHLADTGGNWLQTSIPVNLAQLYTALGLNLNVTRVAFEFVNTRQGSGAIILLDDFSLQQTATTAQTINYNASGYVTDDSRQSFSSAAYHPVTQQLLSIQVGGKRHLTVSMRYTADQNRWSKVARDATTQAERASVVYLYGGGNKPLVELRTVDGQTTTHFYMYGPDGLIATRIVSTGDQTSYVLKDHLGSSRVLVDENGQVVAAWDYLLFGDFMRTSGASTLPYLYAGYEYDDEMGVYHCGSRLYSPGAMRFLMPDPLFQYHNPYVYAWNNPVTLVDSAGTQALYPYVIQQHPMKLAHQRITMSAMPAAYKALATKTPRSWQEQWIMDYWVKRWATVYPLPARLEDHEAWQQIRQKLNITSKAAHRGAAYTDDALHFKTLDWRNYETYTFTGIDPQGRPLGRNGELLKAGVYMFTLDVNHSFRYLEQVQINEAWEQFRSHSQIAGGVEVYSAGRFHINEQGQITWIDNSSGHYRPAGASLMYAVYVLAMKYGLNVWSPELETRGIPSFHTNSTSIDMNMTQFNPDIYAVPPQPTEDMLYKAVFEEHLGSPNTRSKIAGIAFHRFILYPFYYLWGKAPQREYFLGMRNDNNTLHPW